MPDRFMPRLVRSKSLWLALVLVVVNAVAVIASVQNYRMKYATLTRMNAESTLAEREWFQLLIEQQTFGATPVIEDKARDQLKMLAPTPAHTVLLAPAHLEP